MSDHAYDPSMDEPKYSEREREAMLGVVIPLAVGTAFWAGYDRALDELASLPLRVFGRWQQDTVYPAKSLVFHNGSEWLSVLQTAGEPSGNTGAWRRIEITKGPQEVQP